MNPIGRHCVVRDLNHSGNLVHGIVIDAAGGRAKRVRLQSGEHAGEVRLPSQYAMVEFMESGGDARSALSAAFSELAID